MRCPRQSALINRAKNLMTVPFKRLPEWDDISAQINAETWLKPLNTLRTEMPAQEDKGAVATLPSLWVLSFIHNWEHDGWGIYSCLNDWDEIHCGGHASDEERGMMFQMLEDWHRRLTSWMIDWHEYQEDVCEEDWAKTWFLEDFEGDYEIV